MQAGNHQFLNFDDDVYIINNPYVASGMTYRNIIWAFTSVDTEYWHPVTWLSYMMDVELYGMNPRGHHLTNVAIHTVSSVLLLLLLCRMTGALWRSAFVAFLFALHPQHVESVAWAVERKDVLSAFFCFLTLLIYAEYAEKRKPAMYGLALLSFMLGLMSKPMLVTLPVLMLLLDYWPLDRLREGEQNSGFRQLLVRVMPLIQEKVPFFACSLLSGLITLYSHNKAGAVSKFTMQSFQLCLENALLAYVKYIGKTVWPHNLAIVYPFPFPIPFWQVISSLFILLLISVAVIRTGRRYPYILTGWFWFVVTLVPVIGLINAGLQVAMADRFSYIPHIGLFMMLSWGAAELTEGVKYRQALLALLAGMVITASAAASWRQLGYWKDSITLYRHTLQVTTKNYIIHHNLGLALASNGDFDAAIREYQEALRGNPADPDSHRNLGAAYQGKGDLDAAIREYQEAIRLAADSLDAHYNLAVAFDTKGDLEAAIHEYQEVFRINPDHFPAHNNLGAVLARKGDLPGAIHEFSEAIRLNHDDAMAHNNLGSVLAQKGDLDGAIREFREAVRINPAYAKAHNNLATAIAQKELHQEGRK